MNLPTPMRSLVERLTPRQRQYAMLGAILLGGVGLLWLVFAFAEGTPSGQASKTHGAAPGPVTNIGVMPPGQQVNPVDQWVGTAGSKLAQYESEREEQGRLNKDRQAFEARTMQRFAELEQRLTATTQAVQSPVPAPVPSPVAPAPSLSPPSALPPPPPAPRAPAAGAGRCRPASRRHPSPRRCRFRHQPRRH